MSRYIQPTSKHTVNTEFQYAGQTNYKLLITENAGKIYSFLMRDGRLYKVFCESDEAFPLGTVVIGKVMNVLNQMNGAFVKLGKAEDGKEDIIGYLPVSSGDAQYKPLNRTADGRILAGDEVLVKVSKEALKSKQCQLSLSVEISGQTAVVQAGNGKIKFSKKLSQQFTKEFREKFINWKKVQTQELQTQLDLLNILFRTNTMHLEFESVMEELIDLTSQKNIVDLHSQTRSVFSIISKPSTEYMQLLQNLPLSMLEEVVTDIPSVFDTIQKSTFYQRIFHENADLLKLRLYQDEKITLSRVYSLDTKLKELLSIKAYMKSGAYLIIEPTEALIAIDVNTGKSMKKEDPETFFFQCNMEAAQEIFYQLSVRNLSGMILVDFINMKNQENIDRLLTYVKKEAKKDPVTTLFIDYTKLGLVELTRMKSSKPLKDVVKDWQFT